jgi:hypothetical protein
MVWPAQESQRSLALSAADILIKSDLGPASFFQEAVGMLDMLASSLRLLPCSLLVTYHKSNGLFPMLL